MKLPFLRRMICVTSIAALAALAGCSSDRTVQGEMEKQGEAAERQMDKMGQNIDDAAITTAVKSKLAADVRLSTIADIGVETENGVVTLDGAVESDAIKAAAEDAAHSVDGVLRVSNQIRVEPKG
jgi:hyperosmotically inducible protein